MALGDRQADDMRALDGLRVESDDLRASRKRLALAADAERRGLERALHDGVQQQLVGFAANLELAARSMDADPAAAKDLLAEMARDIRDAMDQARELADRIYPPQLEVGGLVAALRSAAADAEVPARIEIARDQTYPPEVAGTMYFCFRDLLETRLGRLDGGDHDTERWGRGRVRHRRGRRPPRGPLAPPRSHRGSRRPLRDRVGVRPP